MKYEKMSYFTQPENLKVPLHPLFDFANPFPQDHV